MIKYLLFFLSITTSVYGVLAGGRPNSISGGVNAFAGVLNPANAVWIEDRLDIGMFLVFPRSYLDNRNNTPLFPQGKTNFNYKTNPLVTADAAIHKKMAWERYEGSISLATYTTPAHLKLRTKIPLPLSGTTPMQLENKVQAVSAIFSLKLNSQCSVGLSIDYFYLSHRRNGFQRSDNPLRSVSPGNVTNRGMDHSSGIGLSLGWRWNITNTLAFGASYTKKSSVGQYRRYRGYEPHHAKNYIPETFGAGFTYKFTQKIAGRLEVLQTNFGNLPGANNNILSNGDLNTNKRGSNKSPGPGMQNATFINCGLGYHVNKMLALGVGFSHRIKRHKGDNILSHTYTFQTLYNILSFGGNFTWEKHNFSLLTPMVLKIASPVTCRHNLE